MSYSYKLTAVDEVTRSDGLVIKITSNVTPELQGYWAWMAERARVAIIQNWMDEVARGFEFVGGIDSVATFTSSANKQYAEQAKALLEWRDAVWVKFESIRSEDFTPDQLKRRLPEPPKL